MCEARRVKRHNFRNQLSTVSSQFNIMMIPENRFDSKTVIEASRLFYYLSHYKIKVSLYHLKLAITFRVTKKAYQSNFKVLQLKSLKHMKRYPL